MRKYQAKFFGTKIRKGTLSKQDETLPAKNAEDMEKQVRAKYEVVNGLRIREIKEDV